MRVFFLFFIALLFNLHLFGQDTTQHYTLRFSSSNIKILSDAYLHYASNFRDVYLSFKYDSTLFNERYNDTTYIKTTLRKEYHVANRDGQLGSFYYSMEYGFFGAKIVKVKIGSKKFWALNIEQREKFKKNEQVYNFDEFTLDYFPVMVFPNMQDKKELKEFIRAYEIGDHRIYYDKMTNIFEIELKTSDSFVRKVFFPYYKKMQDQNDVEIADLYYDKFRDYAKELHKKEDQFNRDHSKNLIKMKRDQQKLYDRKWRRFQDMYMSDEEKKMSQEEWMEYYKLIIQDEFRAVMNSEPKKGLLDRYLHEIGYRNSEMDLINPKLTLKLKSENAFAMIDQLVAINLTQMYYCHAKYSNANHLPLNLTPGDRYAFLLKTTGGDYGIVTTIVPDNEDLMDLEFKPLSKELVSIELISKKAGL